MEQNNENEVTKVELISNEVAEKLINDALVVLYKKNMDEKLYANTVATIEPTTGVVTGKLYMNDKTYWEMETYPDGKIKDIIEFDKKGVIK